jgi:sporulation protein YlmC with PRC-barrel domain
MVHALVPSNRVETAAIYGRDGQKIGTIERLMLEKKTGTVAHAVVRSGGFLKAATAPRSIGIRSIGPCRAVNLFQ